MYFGQHSKIGIGWAICIFGGLYSFYWAKTNIDKQRYENMKARQRMRDANVGAYDPSARKFSTQE